MDRPLLHRRARAAQGRPQEIQATKALPAVARPPVGAGGRMAGPRLVAAAHQRQAARPVAGRCAHARVPGDHLPMGLLQQAASGTLGAVPAARAQAAPQARRQEDVALPDSRPSAHLRTPPEADGRSAFGHWEADSVIGVGCNLHTEVERRTRFLMARIVPDKTAGESVGAQLDMFSPLPAGARVSVTHDNGTEFAHHERLRDGLGMATYFADPYSSWQRGSNENRNGMIRRYLPKRCEIRMDMAKEVREIVDEINNRPMRVLDYRTPAEAFADELLELQDQQGCCTSK